MGWHDSRIHAVAFLTEKFELAFDIDYILRWVQPSEDEYHRFWVAPATLVFENIHEVKFDIEPFEDLKRSRLPLHGRKPIPLSPIAHAAAATRCDRRSL